MLALVGFVGLCLLVGAVDGTITARAVQGWYPSLTAPPLTPPNWVFGPVWTVLYVLMGTAGWLAWRRSGASRPLRLWGWQLAANAVWPAVFFGLHSPIGALVVIVALLALILATLRSFRRITPLGTLLMLPYFGWTLFATYLNAGFWWLNAA